MRTRTSFAVVLAAAALAAWPVAAAPKKMEMAPKQGAQAPEGVGKTLAAQQAAMAKLAHDMMGQITLASVALDAELPDEARAHIEKADGLAAQIAKQAPEVSSETQLKYGKMSYKIGDSTKDYYVPIMDDLFVLSDYQTTFHAWKDRSDIEETDAGVVRVTIDADIRDVKKALAKARKQVDAGQRVAAADSLAGIFRDAIVNETVITDPVWAVHDNLSLARALIREGQYDGARYALGHARKSLAALEQKHADDAASQPFQKMDDELGALEQKLAQKDPSLTARVDARFYDWMNTVKSWL